MQKEMNCINILYVHHDFEYLCMCFLLKQKCWQVTAELRLTATLLIQSPHYYGPFFLA